MSRLKSYLLPAYLLLCIVVGGSSQAVWGNAFLQLLSLAILGWTALASEPEALSSGGRRLLLIVGATALLLLVQLIPLPPALWVQLPGRAFVAEGLLLLGLPNPWLPISLSPYDTMATGLTLLPPLALMVAMLRLRSWSSGGMFMAVLAGALISILFSILQVSGGTGDAWYLYQRTNLGIAVGTFANGNHYATILLATLPMLGALAAARWRLARTKERRGLILAQFVAAGALLATGILISRSSAMLLLGPPVAAATALIAFRLPPRRTRQAYVAIGLLLFVAAAVLAFAGKNLPSWGTDASVQTRAEIWTKSAQAANDHLLTGTGIGTFDKIYQQYEDPADVDRWFVNHAHNDFLELAVEGGLPALLILGAFVLWWAAQASAAWRSPIGLEQRAAVVSSAVILLHSIFDYPLRTTAIAAIFAVCLALLAGARGTPESTRQGLNRVRHATL